ncbi:MAG TPA: DUF4159 domain-containing protein [Stellaceae bacterium]|jgi:hypothetical protein
MLSLGSLAFASPWLLLGLGALPILWWLLRVTPPAPRRMPFPAIRLLLGLQPREETAAHTPLWLILLRMALAAAIIFALAHPLLNPSRQLAAGSGPLLLVVDDGWAAARHWTERQTTMAQLIDRADREKRQVVLVGTAPLPGDEAARPLQPMRAADARIAAETLTPRPWPVDRRAALGRIEAMTPAPAGASVVWLSDGIDQGGSSSSGAAEIAERLQRLAGGAGVRVLTDDGDDLARLLAPAERESTDLAVSVRRADAARETQLFVRATADDGRLLAREPLHFGAGTQVADIRLPMPSELRNHAARIEIEGEASAGAVMLLDERWRRRPVGIVTSRTGQPAQPLLSDIYYLDRALAPFSEVRHGTVEDLLRRETAVLILPDSGPGGRAEHDAIVKWMEAGGVVVRFAGPAMAESSDDLLPVRLRRGGRTIGGALSWERPARLAPFAAESPFNGLAVPDDVTVSRQVLAEPTLDLGGKTWARLTDGTPLVTGEKRGDGWLALIHTTAGPAWSNLSISGLFVEMLRRVVGMSQGVAGAAEAALPPVETLDGFGRLQHAPGTARPIAAGALAGTVAGPATPPGFYGTPDARRALNLASAVKDLAPIGTLPAGVAREGYARGAEIDMQPWLLAAALLVALADLVIAYALRGLLSVRRRRRPGSGGAATAAGVALAAALLGSGAAHAAEGDDAFAVQATSEMHLAYVRTGIPQIDDESRAGLSGLTAVLNRRTAVDAADPMEVDVEQDELIFFPLLYWPIATGQPPLSPAAAERVNRYLATGGTILFDTRDQSDGGVGSAGGSERLRQLLGGVKVPPLAPVTPDHVLTKSFYLLQEFPGRWSGGTIWVEPVEDRVNDGVSTVIVGGNDWAGAWATDAQGRPANAVVPGGEPQREMAYRFGVNLVMYCLTGNYKTDQVHVPAILERLGQ